MLQPSHGQFDPLTKTYFNANTGKWVKRLRPSKKGKSDIEKWKELGSKKKSLFVPVNTDIELIKATARRNSLNYEHMLFILHKLLYNRLMLRKSKKVNDDYLNNYTALSSKELLKWLGNDYVRCLEALIDIEYLFPKLTSHRTKSYFNSNGKKGNSARFKINPKLFNYSLFDHPNFFKAVELNDIRLTLKLIKQSQLKSPSNHPVHSLLCKALEGVRISTSVELLNRKYPHEIVQQMILLINKINEEEIYVRTEMDQYGERFHSTFTFSWSALRPLIYFENKEGNTAYLDLRNSQFFFLSLLGLPQTYQLIPEYENLLPLFQAHERELSCFNHHCQLGTLYSWCEREYGLSKVNLMEITFASSLQFKAKRKKLAWLTKIIEEIEKLFSKNILPSILQKLESRTMLNRICFEFLSKNENANLISIHDGILVEERYLTEIVNIIHNCFMELNLPVPAFKTEVHSRLQLK